METYPYRLRFGANDTLTAGQTDTLWYMATDCIHEGGIGAVMARTLLMRDSAGLASKIWSDDCNSGGAGMKRAGNRPIESQEVLLSEGSFKIYPTIAEKNGNFTIEATEAGYFLWTDLLGRDLGKVNFGKDKTTVSRNEMQDYSGVVMVRWFLEDGKSGIEKIIIQ